MNITWSHKMVKRTVMLAVALVMTVSRLASAQDATTPIEVLVGVPDDWKYGDAEAVIVRSTTYTLLVKKNAYDRGTISEGLYFIRAIHNRGANLPAGVYRVPDRGLHKKLFKHSQQLAQDLERAPQQDVASLGRMAVVTALIDLSKKR